MQGGDCEKHRTRQPDPCASSRGGADLRDHGSDPRDSDEPQRLDPDCQRILYYPAKMVKSRFRKLSYFHVEYVIECLRKNTTKVKNIRKYLLTALFNAPATMEGYYRAEVNHDMPELADL